MVNVEIKTSRLEYAVEESYKAVRANLLFCGEDKKLIAITSCTPNEGKSTVSLNLAISLAEGGKKVLLIDADLRKSVLMGRVSITENIGGLAHLLSRQTMAKNVICSTNVPNLHMIFAGTNPPNPSELLGGKNFKNLLNSVKEIYDYILIDTPPLGSVIDSAIIAEKCDGTIIVMEAVAIGYRLAQKVKDQIEKTKCPILGVIINKAKIDKHRYYGEYQKY